MLPADYDFESHRELVGMQPGDVPVTYADSSALEADYSFKPTIGIREGLRKFAEWYKEYYGGAQRADAGVEEKGIAEEHRNEV